MEIKIQGFHGTSFENAKKIILNNFELSAGNSEWLGDGVYYFIKGLSEKPNEQAQNWAIAQSWDNSIKRNKYKNFSVIKSEISVSIGNFLDLTTNDGVEIFDYIIEKHRAKMKAIGKKLTYVDGYVINFARDQGIIPIEVVKGNMYIKFTRERLDNINRRTANCTICSVYNVKENIKSSQIVLNGSIS